MLEDIILTFEKGRLYKIRTGSWDKVTELDEIGESKN